MSEPNVTSFLRISEPSELHERLRTVQMKAVARRPSDFGGSVAFVEFGDIAVEIVRTSPVLMIEGVQKGRAGCLLMLEGAGGAKWDGRSVHACDVVALAPDATLVASFHDPYASAFVSTSERVAERMLGSWTWAAGGRGPPQVKRSTRAAHERLSECVRAIETVARHTPGVLRHDQSRIALRASLIEATQALCQPGDTTKSGRTRGSRRQRTVRLVDEYLCANPVRPVYTDDLCQALGVSASALHEAFQDVFEMSPHRYLKLRRMSLVRVALSHPGGSWHSVKAAALSYGFWHLSQFAQDYREIYGELPSATLARSGETA